jgi:hypothetical protein
MLVSIRQEYRFEIIIIDRRNHRPCSNAISCQQRVRLATLRSKLVAQNNFFPLI